MLGNHKISWGNHEHRLWLLVNVVWISCEFALYSWNVNVFVVNNSVSAITQTAEYLHWGERQYANCSHGWLLSGRLSSVNCDFFLLVVCLPAFLIPHLEPFSPLFPAHFEEISLALSVVCAIHSLWPVRDDFDISNALRGGKVFHEFLNWCLFRLFDDRCRFAHYNWFSFFLFFNIISDLNTARSLRLLDFAFDRLDSIREAVFFANLMQLIKFFHTDQALDGHRSLYRSLDFTQHWHVSNGLLFPVHLTQHDPQTSELLEERSSFVLRVHFGHDSHSEEERLVLDLL